MWFRRWNDSALRSRKGSATPVAASGSSQDEVTTHEAGRATVSANHLHRQVVRFLFDHARVVVTGYSWCQDASSLF